MPSYNSDTSQYSREAAQAYTSNEAAYQPQLAQPYAHESMYNQSNTPLNAEAAAQSAAATSQPAFSQSEPTAAERFAHQSHADNQDWKAHHRSSNLADYLAVGSLSAGAGALAGSYGTSHALEAERTRIAEERSRLAEQRTIFEQQRAARLNAEAQARSQRLQSGAQLADAQRRTQADYTAYADAQRKTTRMKAASSTDFAAQSAYLGQQVEEKGKKDAPKSAAPPTEKKDRSKLAQESKAKNEQTEAQPSAPASQPAGNALNRALGRAAAPRVNNDPCSKE